MSRVRYLAALSNAIKRWPKAFVVLGIILAIVSAVYTVKGLDFKTSRNDLIGRDSEYMRNFDEYAHEFSSEEDYIVVVESDSPERNRAAVDAIAKALLDPANNSNPKYNKLAQNFVEDDLFYKVNYDALKPWFLYYLEVGDLEKIRGSIKDFKQLLAILQHKPKLYTFFDTMNQMFGQMEGAAEAQRRDMESFLPTITKVVDQMAVPQTNTTSQFLSPWASAFFSDDMVGEADKEMKWGGYQVYRDGKMYLLLIHPRRPEKQAAEAFHEATVPKVEGALASVQSDFSDVKINLTGEPVLDYKEMLTSQHDAMVATVITLVLIIVIFAFGFREIVRPMLGVFCMILVIAMSMGWATLSVGHLNIITVTFAVMLLGLGIDLGIQLIARFEEEFSRSKNRVDAVCKAIQNTGTSIFTAGLTNAAAFFAMGLSGFKGVIELGIIAGGGLVIATIMTMVVLPALVLVVHRKKESTSIPAQAAAGRFEDWLLKRPYKTLLVCAALTVGSLVCIWNARFDYNVLNLQSKHLPAVDTELRLLKADAESTIFAAVVCTNLDETRVMQSSLTGLPTVGSAHSIAEIIPENQQAKVGIIRKIQDEMGEIRFQIPPFDPADIEALTRSLGSLRVHGDKLIRAARDRKDEKSLRVLEPMVESLKKARARIQQLDEKSAGPIIETYEKKFYADLESQMKLMTTQITDRTMGVDDVPKELRRMLVGKTGKFLVRVFPKENIWDRAPLVRFVNDVRKVAPHVTGTPLGLFEFVEILLHGYIKAALWAFLVIVIIIAIDLRGILASILTLLPLITGMIWMVGVMGVFGIQFNPANIMTLPLMVGIGVAYGVYIVQRYRQEGETTFYSKSTGRAVILSGLNSLAAFATLIIGAHQGIRSLGIVMTIGILACLVSGMILLPACLQIAKERGWKV